MLVAGDAAADESRESPRLTPTGNGTYAIDDLVTTAHVAPDGTLRFDDKSDFAVEPAVPWDLAAWARDPYRDQRAAPTAELARHLTAVPGACDRWGDPLCDPTPGRVLPSLSGDGVVLPLARGRADGSAALQRLLVGDPYASRKLKLVDATREERAARGAVYRDAQLRRSAELVDATLVAAWASTTDPAARREALFELWDDCAESEDAIGEAGARARQLIVGFIRARLPPSSADAFSRAEIARLDARRTSREHFDPYR
ncbi:MAG TPA: hypothetical protein VFQ53_26630 [Kofleriaceae bacterium]|nr:hypothetical protein [Kofleriaceae bacterium]